MKQFYSMVGLFALFVIIHTISRSHLAEALLAKGKPGQNSPCSKILCTKFNVTKLPKGSHVNCTVLDNCKCENLDLKNFHSGSYVCNINCPKLPAMQLMYDKNSEFVSVACTEYTDGFDTFYREIQDILAIVSPKRLHVFSCNKRGVEWDFHNGCKINEQPFIDGYNMLNAGGLIFDKLRGLALSKNCFTELEGSFPARFQFLQTIDFSSNLLTRLPDNAFRELHFLGELILAKNKISTLTPLTFNGLFFLHTLDISSNNLTSIPENAFIPMRHLFFLYINNNQIHTLSGNTFYYHPYISEINIGNNFLETLPVNIFDNLTYLSTLTLNENKFSVLPDYLFDGLMQLETLELQGNRLKTLPDNFFQSNIRLRELDLSNNFFSDLLSLTDAFKFMVRLIDLKLVNNNITKLVVPLNTMKLFAARLDMSQNCLEIDETVFDSSARRDLAKFNFTCTTCCIKNLDFSLVSGVSSASFKNNKIDTLDMNFLKLIADMEEIDISHNNIRNVNVKWDYPLVDMDEKKHSSTIIRLHNNPVTCDCYLVPFLEIITNVTSAPFGLSKSKLSFDVVDMYCIEPVNLLDTQVWTLLDDKEKIANLICNKETLMCPSNCYCKNMDNQDIMVVNCTSRKLSNLPLLVHFKQAIRLHVENNIISNLSPLPISVWSNIHELYLDNNNLTSADNLMILPSLNTLSLRNNSLEHISGSMQLSLTTHNLTLFLSENPWECTCDFLKMMEILKNKNNVKDYNDVSCVFPGSSVSTYVKLTIKSSVCKESAVNNLLQIILPTIIVSIIVLLVICAAVCYRFKERIKLWINRSPDTECFVMDSQ